MTRFIGSFSLSRILYCMRVIYKILQMQSAKVSEAVPIECDNKVYIANFTDIFLDMEVEFLNGRQKCVVKVLSEAVSVNSIRPF